MIRRALVLGLAVLGVGAAVEVFRLLRVAVPSLSDRVPVDPGPGPVVARRLVREPILRADLSPELQEEARRFGYVNLNGPSLIRVPDWVPGGSGRYHLYFAHHKGEWIRLAVADRLTGPWRVLPRGVLHLSESGFPARVSQQAGILASLLALRRATRLTEFVALARVGAAAMADEARRRERGWPRSEGLRPHIASPDAIVDAEHRAILLAFHGLVGGALQLTRIATSEDARHFRVRRDPVGAPYLKWFRYRGRLHGVAMPGLLYREREGGEGFQVRRRPLLPLRTRHAAVWVRGDRLVVFFSRVGDAPERILATVVDASDPDWDRWTPGPPFEVLRPEEPWEGADLPVAPSLRGEAPLPVHELRDPSVYEEGDRAFLLYAGAGEQAIGIAELFWRPVAERSGHGPPPGSAP